MAKSFPEYLQDAVKAYERDTGDKIQMTGLGLGINGSEPEVVFKAGSGVCPVHGSNCSPAGDQLRDLLTKAGFDFTKDYTDELGQDGKELVSELTRKAFLAIPARFRAVMAVAAGHLSKTEVASRFGIPINVLDGLLACLPDWSAASRRVIEREQAAKQQQKQRQDRNRFSFDDDSLN